MAVISLSIVESSEQIVSGFPKTITITSNVPCNIFYTLNGTVPTLFSNIYTGPIFLPADKLIIILNVLATNGIDYSPILTETYETDLANARLPHSGTDAQAGSNIPGLYPFGSNSPQSNINFTSPGDAGITVDDQSNTLNSNGFDGAGNPNAFTDQPYNTENYSIVYSTTNSQGETGPGIGNIPAKVTMQPEMVIPETTEQFTTTFDPRAFVIFQDITKEDPNDPPQINRQHFTLESSNTRDGNAYFSSALDAPTTSGTFLRPHYNPRTNMMTYYYFDSWANKWIISQQPLVINNTSDGNMQGVSSGRRPGDKYIYCWQPFQRRVLF